MDRMDIPREKTAAAPIPASRLIKSRNNGSLAIAEHTEAMPYSTDPIKKQRLCPILSANAPQVRVKQANIKLKALTTHCKLSMDAPRSMPIAGNASAVPEIELGTTKMASKMTANNALPDVPGLIFSILFTQRLHSLLRDATSLPEQSGHNANCR